MELWRWLSGQNTYSASVKTRLRILRTYVKPNTAVHICGHRAPEQDGRQRQESPYKQGNSQQTDTVLNKGEV